MKYTAPSYEAVVLEANDVICASSQVNIYTDKDGNSVEEHSFSFSGIFNA